MGVRSALACFCFWCGGAVEDTLIATSNNEFAAAEPSSTFARSDISSSSELTFLSTIVLLRFQLFTTILRCFAFTAEIVIMDFCDFAVP